MHVRLCIALQTEFFISEPVFWVLCVAVGCGDIISRALHQFASSRCSVCLSVVALWSLGAVCGHAANNVNIVTHKPFASLRAYTHTP